jgi:hypothetical protein
MYTFVKNVTLVTAVGFFGLAPGYYRVEQFGSINFDSELSLRASACAETHRDRLGELCHLASDVGSDSFFANLFT